MKQLKIFIISLTIFSFLIFFLRSYFFVGSLENDNSFIEDNHIEKSFNDFDELLKEEIIGEEEIIKEQNPDWYIEIEKALNSDKQKEEKTKKELEELEKLDLISAKQVRYYYIPKDFYIYALPYKSLFDSFVNSYYIKDKNKNLKVELYKQENDIRWRMKDSTIKMFWVDNLKKEEFLAVTIHEFAHFVDIYYFDKKYFTDISDYFYDISWEQVKIIKAWENASDFVSWYAMTNKYEDFAESFTYFILHNSSFFQKTKSSEILEQKYNFFEEYLFIDKEFSMTNFSTELEIQDYYWDTTKIEFSLENFLDFLKN